MDITYSVMQGPLLAVSVNGDLNKGVLVETKNAYSDLNFSGSGITDKEPVLDIVNLYFSDPSVTDVDKKRFITILKAASDNLDSSSMLNYRDKRKLAKEYINKVLNLKSFTLQKLNEWARSGVVNCPDTATKVYDTAKEGLHSRETTFLEDEYYDLVALAIFMRIVSPIYIPILIEGVKEFGKVPSLMKALISIPEEIMESDCIDRVTVYSNKFTAGNAIPTAMKVNMLVDDENKMDFSLATAIFKVLFTARLLKMDDKKHIISLLHSKLRSNASGGATGNSVMDKTVNSGSGDDFATESLLESYRTVSTLSIAEIVTLESMCEIGYILNVLGDQINKVEYKRIIKILDPVPLYVTASHVYIMHIVLNKVILSEAYSHMTKDHVKPLMVITHLLLREKHPWLATFILSSIATSDEEALIPTSVGKSRLSDEAVEIIEKEYPLDESLFERVANKGKTHLIVESIEDTAVSINNRVWDILIGVPWLDGSPYSDNGTLLSPINTAQEIFNLVLDRNHVLNDVKTLA